MGLAGQRYTDWRYWDQDIRKPGSSRWTIQATAWGRCLGACCESTAYHFQETLLTRHTVLPAISEPQGRIFLRHLGCDQLEGSGEALHLRSSWPRELLSKVYVAQHSAKHYEQVNFILEVSPRVAG